MRGLHGRRGRLDESGGGRGRQDGAEGRGTKHAVFLANAITFTDGTIYRGDNDALVTRQGQMIKDALDVLQEWHSDDYSKEKAISRAREILIGEVTK